MVPLIAIVAVVLVLAATPAVSLASDIAGNDVAGATVGGALPLPQHSRVADAAGDAAAEG